jgi:hypothetical protein
VEALVSATDLWLFQLCEYVVVDIDIDTNAIQGKYDYSFDVVGGVVINMKSGGVTKTIKC